MKTTFELFRIPKELKKTSSLESLFLEAFLRSEPFMDVEDANINCLKNALLSILAFFQPVFFVNSGIISAIVFVDSGLFGILSNDNMSTCFGIMSSDV